MMAHESHCNEFSAGINATMQGFDHNHELFGIQAGVEMLGVPSKQQNPHLGRGFLHRDFPEASSKNFVVPTETATSASPWPVDASSLRSLFSCGGTEQAAGRLSLSLFNMKHSDAVGVPQHLQQCVSGDKLQLKPAYLQQPQLFMQDGIRFYPQQQPLQLRNSKFLRPAQELLNEFCSLLGESRSRKRPSKASLEEEGKPSLSSSWHHSVYSMDLLELQKIKAQLLSMLEEVDKRYRRYCEEMRTVVASFEAVAGEGAARVYSTLASTTMSRHFRCLRDGIVGQIRAVKKAMGEKEDSAAPGTTRGETPRLKLLDQCIRQQKAFQQGVMEQQPWRPQRGLPDRAVSILRAWLFEHFLHPYPNDVDKHILARKTGLSRSQVSNWFINARVRLWKPMVEEMYLEEMKELDKQSNPATTGRGNGDNPNPNSDLIYDQKPLPEQQHLVDSESLSSFINSSHDGDQRDSSIKKTSLHQYQQYDRHRQVLGAENFDDVGDLDFSYSNCGSGNSRTGVSLTLGLQHHNGGGMSLSLLPNSQQSHLFSREHIDDDQQVHFNILDGEAVNLPYRNLMGAQLLHDLAR